MNRLAFLNNRIWLALGFYAVAGIFALVAVAYQFLSDHHEPPTGGGPLVVRRLTQAEYQRVIADVFGADIKIGGRFEPDIRQGGLLAVGSGQLSVTPAGFEQYDAMAGMIAAQVLDRRRRAFLLPCRPRSDTAEDSACARMFFSEVGRLLFRRPLSDEELRGWVEVSGLAARKLDSFYSGLELGLTGMLAAPQFLFRDEAAEPDPDRPGKMRLNGFGMASRLSFLLWDSAPDDALLAAAERGELYTQAGLARQARRLMASPRVVVGVRAFFSDMLRFDGFGNVAKDPIIYPKYSLQVAADAQEQTLRTITDHLLVRNADYRDLFTTDRMFVDQTLGPIYGVPVARRAGWEPRSQPADRPGGGILSQVSFVALNSHPGRTSPTLRGRALRETFLCQHVPDPPGNVNFNLVQDTANPLYRTARQRLKAHATAPTCAGCHRLTDPIGLALENFDSIGEFRGQENGAAIDASGELDGARFSGPADLGRVLRDNPQTSACLVMRLYAYAVGRGVQKGEQQWLVDLEKDFARDGYRFRSLLEQIALSSAFYRISEASDVAAADQTEATRALAGEIR